MTPPIQAPVFGAIGWLDFDPQAGHEHAGRRPALVLSQSRYNQRIGLAIFCPITSRQKGYPFELLRRMASPFPASCSAIKPAHSIGDSGDGSQFAASMRQSSNTPSQNSPHFSATRNDVFSASLVRRGELTTRRIPLISNSEPPPKTHPSRVSRRVARQSRHQYPKAVASQKYRRDASRSRLPGKTPASAK